MTTSSAAAQGRKARPKGQRYTRQVAEAICERLARGESLRSICKTKGMPSPSTIYDWRDTRPEFARSFARARELAAEACAEEAVEIAKAATPATLQTDKLRVSTLLWRAGRAGGQRPGGGAEPGAGAPRKVIVEVRDFTPTTRDDGAVVTREILPDGSFVDGED
jgi:transposase-like protein